MTTKANAARRGNRILDRLPPRERALVSAYARDVALAPGEVICRAGARVTHVLFPRRGVISLFASSLGSPDVGVGMVGATGMFGLGTAAGQAKSALSASSQGHGSAEQIETSDFLKLMGRSAGLRSAMLGYGYEQSRQLAQNIACIAHHPTQRRLARWMLDLTGGPASGRFSSTQAATATALGVLRPAVSRAAGALQRLGLIRYVRGEIDILDRKGLAAVACACSMPVRT